MTATKKLNIAPLWRRAASFLIDIILVEIFLISPFWTLVRKAMTGDGFADTVSFLAAHPNAAISLNIVTIYISIITMAYFVILQYTMGQTIGMLLLRMKLRSLHNHIHWWQLIIRNMFLIPIFPFVFFIITEPVSLLWTRGESRLLEHLSKTRTVMV